MASLTIGSITPSYVSPNVPTAVTIGLKLDVDGNPIDADGNATTVVFGSTTGNPVFAPASGQLSGGAFTTSISDEVVEQTGLTRTAYLDQTPVDLLNQVFEMEVGEVRVVSDAEGTVVVRLDETLPPDDGNDMQFLTQALNEQLNQSLSNEIFQIYLQAVQSRARPQVNQQAVNSVHATFQ